MIYDNLTIYEQQLIDAGYENIGLDYQNKLANLVAKKLGLPLMNLRPEHILDYHKSIKRAMMNEFYEIDIAKGFTAANGHKYRTNMDDQVNFLGKMILLLMKPEITEIQWKPEDIGDYISHTRDEWLAIAFEGFTHKENQLMKYHTKVEVIDKATTHAEIVAVSWSGTSPHN